MTITEWSALATQDPNLYQKKQSDSAVTFLTETVQLGQAIDQGITNLGGQSQEAKTKG